MKYSPQAPSKDNLHDQLKILTSILKININPKRLLISLGSYPLAIYFNSSLKKRCWINEWRKITNDVRVSNLMSDIPLIFLEAIGLWAMFLTKLLEKLESATDKIRR